jgi:hypothetical protein
MKKYARLSCCLLAFGLALSAQATITNFLFSASYDGSLYNCVSNFNADAQSLTMSAEQLWGPSRDQGILYADSIGDPTAKKLYQIGNDTGLTWSDYHVNVYLDRAFSISNAFTTLPADWSVVITAPVLNPTPVYFGAGEYVGHVDYFAGTLVPNGSELDFQYTLGFGGSLTYRFADELNPTFVPEPGTLSLAALAGLFLMRRHRAHRA